MQHSGTRRLIGTAILGLLTVMTTTLPVGGQGTGTPGTTGTTGTPETPGFPGLEIYTSRTTGLASFVSAADGGGIAIHLPRIANETIVQTFLREYGSLFGISDPTTQLVITDTRTDSLGFVHTTHQQTHLGVKVFSCIIKVHQNPAGAIHAANGDFHPVTAKLSVVPEVGSEQAQLAARALVEHDPLGVEHSELVIVDPGWYGDSAIGDHLAWHVVLSDPINGVRQAFFVDAHTGEVLDQWSMIHTARQREIYDGQELGSIPGLLARSEGDPATGDADIDAAYDYYGDTYDYFFRAFGRDSIDDNGFVMIATVHSTAPGCPNAFWNGVQMVFCTGTVTDDIVGHEMTHGVTEHTASLIYRNQSGQLNESFSDVFGEMIDLFNGDAAFVGTPGGTPWPAHSTGPGTDTPNNLRSICSPSPGNIDGVRWLIGEDAAVFGGAIRDMWDPTCRNDPDFANSVLQLCTFDSGGVHSGSGVPNHAFAMLTDGKSFNGHTVIGIGPIKSGAVWYRALSVYLTVASDFLDAYAAFNQAAQDLIGTFPPDPRTGLLTVNMFTAADAVQVDEALLAVEMDTDGTCGQAWNVLASDAPVFCDGAAVIFSDGFESGPNGWTVSNSSPLTPYDWELISTDVPFGRPGTVWRVADPNIGDCGANDESGSHSLTSPTYALPAGDVVYLVSFTHYLATEGAWDGGNLKISVNGGAFLPVLREAFELNPYNGALRTTGSGNTNPMQGQTAWMGAGGSWGTSVINLGGIAAGGDTVALRFDLGKDGCTGADGWYLDDFMIVRCPDFNGDGTSDHRDSVFIAATEPIYGVGTGVVNNFAIGTLRKSLSDVTVGFRAYADLGILSEFIDVSMEGTDVGRFYEVVDGGDCAPTPNIAEVVILQADFNTLQIDTVLDIAIQGSLEMGTAVCGGDNFIMLTMTYQQAQAGDINGDGVVDVMDLLSLLAAWGPCVNCFEDIDGDGDVGVLDLLIMLANWTS